MGKYLCEELKASGNEMNFVTIEDEVVDELYGFKPHAEAQSRRDCIEKLNSRRLSLDYREMCTEFRKTIS